MFFLKRKIVFFLVAIIGLFICLNIPSAKATDCGNTDLDCLTKKKEELKNQSISYTSQIAIMDNQIKLTEARIQITKGQILDLTLDIDTAGKKIVNLEKSLEKLTKLLLNRIVATYEAGSVQPLELLLSATNASNLLEKVNYLKIVQAHDKRLVYDVQQSKNDYSNQKGILEEKKKKIESLNLQLEAYSKDLEQQKVVMQKLLAETQEEYDRIQAQIDALSANAASSFGVSLIPHSDLSDEFGKYYNQRDANWGNNFIGYSNQTIAAVGCTLTSFAMVAAHYGGSITPADVAANSGNFDGASAYFLKPGPSASGHSASLIDNPSMQDLRDALNSGAVIIAGLSRNGGPYPKHYSDHWVVLRSVDGDSFRINDPGYQDAMNVLLNDHYSGWLIIESRIYR
jgi:peptidoglycan hydrolase CwlO-like protein